MKQGYKVVQYTDQGLYSCIVDGRYRVKYGIGLSSKPFEGCGPLCVFDTLADARCYVDTYFDGEIDIGNEAIYKCEYVPAVDVAMGVYLASAVCDRVPEAALPQGTMLADSVMLTEEVKDLAVAV
jgi:hypothetical protein